MKGPLYHPNDFFLASSPLLHSGITYLGSWGGRALRQLACH